MKPFSAELSLLFDCSCFSSKKTHFQSHDLSKINWQKFLFLAERHRVVPMVYHHFCAWNFTCEITPILKKRAHELGITCLYQRALLNEVDSLFKKENITCLHFKGPTLSQLLFNNANLRQCKDVDILIQRQNAEKAFTLLKKNGFTLTNVRYKKAYLNKRYQKWYKDYTFVKNGYQLELHWRFGDYYPQKMSDTLFNKIKPITMNQHEFSSLALEDYLVYLILHGYTSGFARLHWLCDIKDLLTLKTINLEKVNEKLQKINSRYLLKEILQLCQLIFSKEKITRVSHINRQCINIIKIDKIDAKLSSANIIYRCRAKKLRISIHNKKEKLGFYQRYVFTSYGDWKIFEFPEKLFFMYYICKPIFFIIREFILPSTSKILAKKLRTK